VQGYGGFLGLREKVFFLMQCLGVVIPSQVQFFNNECSHIPFNVHILVTAIIMKNKDYMVPRGDGVLFN